MGIPEVFIQSVIDSTKKMFNFESPSFLNNSVSEFRHNGDYSVVCHFENHNSTGQFFLSFDNNVVHRLLEPYIDFNNEGADHQALVESILEEYANNVAGDFLGDSSVLEGYGSFVHSVPEVFHSAIRAPTENTVTGTVECAKGAKITACLKISK